jgi:hypothetical protein
MVIPNGSIRETRLNRRANSDMGSTHARCTPVQLILLVRAVDAQPMQADQYCDNSAYARELAAASENSA